MKSALSIALGVFFLGSGEAQTTTTVFATGLNAAGGGEILAGTAVNPTTGQVVQHLWSADGRNGLCRIDPDIDTAGPHAINAATCIRTAVGIRLVPGQVTFDPINNDLYMVDRAGNSAGIFRFHYIPSGDSGQGLMNATQQEVVGGVSGGASVCGIGSNVPMAAVLGPDGNLYIGFQKTGNIMRIVAPQTEPLPCSNVQSNIGSTTDHISDFGVAWIGHNLFGVDSVTPVLWTNADKCFSPFNNFTPCPAQRFFNVFNPSSVVSDQPYPSLIGNNLFYWDHLTVTQIANVNNTVTGPVITHNYGGFFTFISDLAVDARVPGRPVLYVADDPSGGGVDGAARWSQVIGPPPPLSPPGAPTNVIALAGNAQAKVSWTPAQDGQPVTSFTVHNVIATNSTLVPDVVIAAPATAATVTGLTNGVSYLFEVLATNSAGSSPYSAPSNSVIPAVPTVPGAPIVVASASNASAQLAWTAPSDGGSPITSYTITALAGGVPAGISQTAAATATGATVTGLTNGTTYTFTVHATNAIGSGPESAPSNAVTPFVPVTPPDLAVTMTGPASVSFGGAGTYSMTITNSGTTAAPQVIVINLLPPIGATLQSATPSQGSCTLVLTTLTCNLGTIAAGSSASITITETLLAQGVNQATAQIEDSTGAPIADPTPGDNTASVTTAISGPTSVTDIQVTGAAQNGGPTHGGADTYTWQIKNGGNQIANSVAFTTTLPAGLPFVSASTPQGTCTGPAPGSGGIITCGAGSLAVGATMVVTVNVTVPVVGTFSVNGMATFNGTDTNTANNSFSVTIQVK